MLGCRADHAQSTIVNTELYVVIEMHESSAVMAASNGKIRIERNKEKYLRIQLHRRQAVDVTQPQHSCWERLRVMVFGSDIPGRDQAFLRASDDQVRLMVLCRVLQPRSMILL